MIDWKNWGAVCDADGSAGIHGFEDALWVGDNSNNSTGVNGFIIVQNTSYAPDSSISNYGGADNLPEYPTFTFDQTSVTVYPYGSVQRVTGAILNSSFFVAANIE